MKKETKGASSVYIDREDRREQSVYICVYRCRERKK